MKIENIRIERTGERSRLVATVIWEDTDRPKQEIYFETDKALEGALAPCADPFLAATVTPALWAGEKRLTIDDPACPELLENLTASAHFFRHWFNLSQSITLEAKSRAKPHPQGEGRAAFFFSGGIDSLSSLRSNRLNFPLDHPGSIKDGIIVYGLEVEDPTAFEHVVDSLKPMARDADVALLSLSTNVRALNMDWVFWYNAYMGPALGAIAQALSGRLGSVVIASDYDVAFLKPHGSHPLVEPYYSSHELKVRYDGITRTRLEKTKLVADWQCGLENLRVCNKPEHYRAGRLNCGDCEKCFRTMLALIALGALGKTNSFGAQDLSAEILEEKVGLHPNIVPYYDELIPAFTRIGRNDLAEAIQRMFVRYKAKEKEGWRGRLRKIDKRHFNGRLRSLKRAIAKGKGSAKSGK